MPEVFPRKIWKMNKDMVGLKNTSILKAPGLICCELFITEIGSWGWPVGQ